MKLEGQEAIERETELRQKIAELEHRLSLIGDVPSPTEDTLFGLSAHHTWHHQRERELEDRIARLTSKRCPNCDEPIEAICNNCGHDLSDGST